MSNAIIKYVDTAFGVCLRTGSSSEITREFGTRHIQSIRNASEDDIAWVKAMGGYVPEGRIAAREGDKA